MNLTVSYMWLYRHMCPIKPHIYIYDPDHGKYATYMPHIQYVAYISIYVHIDSFHMVQPIKKLVLLQAEIYLLQLITVIQSERPCEISTTAGQTLFIQTSNFNAWVNNHHSAWP